MSDSTWDDCLRRLPVEKVDSIDLIQAILRKIAESPTEVKYRTIKLTNPRIQRGIALVEDALEAMLLMGWELLDCDTLFLELRGPDPQRDLRILFSKLAEVRTEVQMKGTAGGIPSPAGGSTPRNGHHPGVHAGAEQKASVMPKSAFQFQNRRLHEALRDQAKESLAEIRLHKAAAYRDHSPTNQPPTGGHRAERAGSRQVRAGAPKPRCCC